jgi:YfiH family protein
VLERRTGSNGVVYYASGKLEAIGIRHGFSTRLGGVSRPPFDSLNLGNPSGCELADEQSHIQENYQRLLHAIGAPGEPPLRVHQVHGNGVARVERDQPFDVTLCADAIVSGDNSRAISVRTADCVPILMASKDGQTVSAIHAGWRGVIANVIAAAVNRLSRDHGMPPTSLVAAIGPCISAPMFEVGAEVVAEFHKAFGNELPIEPATSGKGNVDLRRAVRLQLLACGLPSENVDTTDRCTAAHGDEFFSHRRDKGVTGRMSAVILANAS